MTIAFIQGAGTMHRNHSPAPPDQPASARRAPTPVPVPGCSGGRARDRRRLRIRSGGLSRCAREGRRDPGHRRAPAPRRARPAIRVGELRPPPGRARRGRHRLSAPQGSGADDGAAPAPIRRGRERGRRQALTPANSPPSTYAVTTRRSSTPSTSASWSRTLPADGTTALLCVERDAEACHRSLIAQRIAAEHGVAVIHLRP